VKRSMNASVNARSMAIRRARSMWTMVANALHLQ
jgi:hypothetical protein